MGPQKLSLGAKKFTMQSRLLIFYKWRNTDARLLYGTIETYPSVMKTHSGTITAHSGVMQTHPLDAHRGVMETPLGQIHRSCGGTSRNHGVLPIVMVSNHGFTDSEPMATVKLENLLRILYEYSVCEKKKLAEPW
jgi:hypothetical protein